jgi:lipocalin
MFAEMKRLATTAAVVVLAAAGSATTTTERRGLPPLQTVAAVDVGRHLGTWYEIASLNRTPQPPA